MSESAPEEVIKFLSEDQTEMHKKIAANLTAVDHPVRVEDINPEDNSPLNRVEEALGEDARVVGRTLEEIGERLTGDNITYSEQAPVSLWAKIKAKLTKEKSDQAKKAA